MGGGDLCGRTKRRLPVVIGEGGIIGTEEGDGCHGEMEQSPHDYPAAQKGCSNSLTTGSDSNNAVDDNNKSSGGGDNTLAAGYVGVSSCRSPANPTLYHVTSCTCELCRRERSRRLPGPPARPTFKFVGVEPKLVSATLQAQKFARYKGARASRGGARTTWQLLWSSQHLRCRQSCLTSPGCVV